MDTTKLIIGSHTEEELRIAEHLLQLEENALKLWFNGDTSGYRTIYSHDDFSYFDSVRTTRIDSYDDFVPFLDQLDGKLFASSYEICNPRVQIKGDTAVFTFQLYAKTNIIDVEYNCIEVYQKQENGEWLIIHSTWAMIAPFVKLNNIPKF